MYLRCCLQIPPKLVHSEWTRGARLACTICGQPGATVCCKGIREVRRASQQGRGRSLAAGHD